MMHVLLFTLIITHLFSQDFIDQYIDEVLSGNTVNATEKISNYITKYPTHPGVVYLSALLETDGELAKEKFITIYNNHKTSPYAEHAIIKISEYYYVGGLYLQSANWLKKIPKHYSQSEYLEESIKLFINAMIVSGSMDSAIYYTKPFKKQFPKLESVIVEVKSDYEENAPPLQKKEIVNEPKKNQSKKQENKNIIVKIQDLLDRVKDDLSAPLNEYSLQVGAFSKRSNAEYQRQIFLNGGYEARIESINSTGILLYIVRVGYYNSRTDAKRAQSDISSRLAISTIIVKNE